MNKIVLLLLTAFMFSCQDKTEKKKTDTPHVPVIKNGLKIAYYYQDSLKTGFYYYKKTDSLVTKKQLQFQGELEKRQKSLQDFIVTNDERAKSGQLSGFELQNIQQEAQRKEQSLYQYQQTEGTRIEKETMEQLDIITKKVESAGKDFCKKNNIDILLIHGPGGQLNFIDPTMNVTSEFINYLNEYQDQIEKDAGLKK